MDTSDEQPESPVANMEGEEANENEISQSYTQEDEDIAGVEAELEGSHATESSEHDSCAFESTMTPVEMDEQDAEMDSSGEIEVKDIPGTGADVYNSNVVSSDNECGSNIDGANIDENEVANETEATDQVESERELQGTCDEKRDSPEPLSSEDNTEGDHIGSVENESEDEKHIDDVNELDIGVNQNNSNVDNISESDRIRDQFEHERIKERSQSPGSSEVSSTSLDKAVLGGTLVSESIQKVQEDHVQFSRQIDNICPETEHCRQEIDSFKYSNSDKFTGRGSDVTNVDSLQQSINIVEKGSQDSNELDNLSTLSVNGSSNSEDDDDVIDDDDNDNLDLTEGSDERVHLSQRYISDRHAYSDIQTVDISAENVTSSANVVDKDLLKTEKATAVKELIDINTEVEEGEIAEMQVSAR